MRTITLILVVLIGFVNMNGQDTSIINMLWNSLRQQLNINQSRLQYILRNLVIHESTEVHYIASVPLNDSIGLVHITEPNLGYVEIYMNGELIMRGTTPLSFAITQSANYEFVLIYNGFQWVRTIFLSPGREYFIGVPGLEEYVMYYRQGIRPRTVTYISPYTGTIVVEDYTSCSLMDTAEFNHLLLTIKNASFSDEKIAIIRSAASGHCFTVPQALTILSQLSFDDDKLIAAKILANALINPQDAYLLADAFTFSDTKEKFLLWLGQ